MNNGHADTAMNSTPKIKMGRLTPLIAAVTMFVAPETRNRDLTAIDHKPHTAGNDSRSDAWKAVLS